METKGPTVSKLKYLRGFDEKLQTSVRTLTSSLLWKAFDKTNILLKFFVVDVLLLTLMYDLPDAFNAS